ncbi:FtsX-like permease family protein [Rhodococcus fascians]|nr:FtsX-like permease family protein [Rhodococcus fascians]MBY4238048.1 FtsX-like permease family protein [Rhodococcus fascians]MBY4254023.1 FtsX-like permease family protein [Rhodococcus fascians]MBY4269593.1 FtsX-like permease family protein [Rhodococcus fascians]
MMQLALRTLRFRMGTFVAAFVAMLCAAAILMACGGLIETGIRTAVPPQRLASADVVVAGNQEYRATGGDPDEPAILPERVRIDAGLQSTIMALPAVETAETYVFEGTSAAGTVDAIGVVAEPGTDVGELRQRIDAEVDSAIVSTFIGDERGQAELSEAKGTGVNVVALAGVFTAFAIMVSVFGVASMLALSIAQRRQELALLRAVGSTPRQVRRLIFRETLVLSVVATAFAYVPGQLLGQFIFHRLSDRGIAANGVVFHQGWIPTAVAMGVAVLAALAGALGAGRRAARIKPTQALTEVAVETKPISGWRLLLAAVLLAGGAALTIVTVAVLSGPMTPATAAPAAILLSVGFALLAPVLAKVTTLVLQWPVRALGGVTGQLAVFNARGRSVRMAAVIAPVVLLTGVATGMMYLQTTNDDADRKNFANSLVADVVVTADGQLDPTLVEQVEGLPGVAGASEYVASTGFIEYPEDRSPMGEGWSLHGVDARGVEATTPARISAGTFADLEDDTIAIESRHAHRLGVDVGDTLTLRMGDNTALDLTIAALFTAPDDYDTLLLPVDTLAAHTTEGFATRLFAGADQNTDPGQLVAEVTELVAGQDGLTVGGRDVLLEEYDGQTQIATFAIYIMVLMIAGYTAITVINTLASSTAARRREFGLQRLAGSTRGQVMRMVGLEGAIVAVSGLALGTIAATLIVIPVSIKRLGSVLPAGSPLIYAATVGLVVLLTLGATLLPAWQVTRSRPAEAVLAIE